MGCESCRQWGPGWIRESDVISECADSFQEVDDYFSAKLVGCPSCGATLLDGYHEDLSTRAIGDFGDRTWILRELTPEHIGEIEAARGTRSLQIDTFAGSETWFQSAEPWPDP